jgi:hypothetical protein
MSVTQDVLNDLPQLLTLNTSLLLWGRTRIDVCSKGSVFARHGSAVIGLNTMDANDNVAPQADVAIAA